MNHEVDFKTVIWHLLYPHVSSWWDYKFFLYLSWPHTLPWYGSIRQTGKHKMTHYYQRWCIKTVLLIILLKQFYSSKLEFQKHSTDSTPTILAKFKSKSSKTKDSLHYKTWTVYKFPKYLHKQTGEYCKMSRLTMEQMNWWTDKWSVIAISCGCFPFAETEDLQQNQISRTKYVSQKNDYLIFYYFEAVSSASHQKQGKCVFIWIFKNLIQVLLFNDKHSKSLVHLQNLINCFVS